MNIHKNARTVPLSRALLVERVTSGWTVSEAAEASGLSERRSYEWLGRHREGQDLHDRSSRPHRSPKKLQDDVEAEIIGLRMQRLTYREISSRTSRSLGVISRVLRAAKLSRLSLIDSPLPAVPRSFECIEPGGMIHVDIKALGKIGNQDRRPLANGKRIGKKGRLGWEYLHVAIDDHTRLSYSEIMSAQDSSAAVRFLLNALSWFKSQHIVVKRLMTDNGGCYRSHLFAAACVANNLKHRRTRPYTPRTNGKAERFIQTICREWIYRFHHDSSDSRASGISRFLHFYNYHRRHTALSNQPPVSRLKLNNVSELHTQGTPRNSEELRGTQGTPRNSKELRGTPRLKERRGGAVPCREISARRG